MITILHGDDTQKSRDELLKIKTKNVATFYPESFDMQNLIQLVEGSGLFEPTSSIVFEEFLGGKIDVKNIFFYVNKHAKDQEFYFWDSKQLSPTQLSNFNKASVKLFKLPQSIFSFLDSLKPSSCKYTILNFHNALVNTGADFLFHMIIRQFRLMIMMLDPMEPIDDIKRLASWQKSKLKKQADLFGRELLIRLYKKLYQIEYQQKTGLLIGDLERQIDFFLLSF